MSVIEDRAVESAMVEFSATLENSDRVRLQELAYRLARTCRDSLAVCGNKPVEIEWVSPQNLELSCKTCTAQGVNEEVVKTGDVRICYSDALSIH
jgi:hypothetical protein